MWARYASVLLGLWLLAAPYLLGYTGIAAANDQIVGPIAASVSTIALWEATRSWRWINLPLGCWLILGWSLLGVEQGVAIANDMLAGVVLALLVGVRGPVRHRFGGGWAAVLRKPDRPI